LYRLLSIDIDVNGDGQITFSEMIIYLKSRSIYSLGMEAFPVWCSSSVNCHSVMYSVANFYSESSNYFQTSKKHKFDGSGLDIVTNLSSTFPSPSWTDEKCRRYDSSNGFGEYQKVQTSWNFTHRNGLQKVCGYVNGLLSSDFTTTKILTGQQTHFVDDTALSPTHQFKRVYCIFLYYLIGGFASTGFECSVGLIYVRILLMMRFHFYYELMIQFIAGWNTHRFEC
jgi:hypothetical protein